MVAGVVLAAGAATRFGGPKQALLVPRRRRAAFAPASVDGIVVVTGAHPLETTAPLVRCPDWERGPGASLRCGLGRARATASRRRWSSLADGPDISPAAVDRVIEVWRESGAEVVAATYGGNRGHPVLLAARRGSRSPTRAPVRCPRSPSRATTWASRATSTSPPTSRRGTGRRAVNDSKP